MGAAVAVSIEDLHVTRGRRTVLDGLDLEVPVGQVVGLLGPSGGGKSTLMRAIVGVQIIQSGTITVLGCPAGARLLRNRVGYLTQAPSVYGDLSVHDNLDYFAALLGVGRRAVTEALHQVGLKEQAEQRVDRLSGGQRSRVSLAAALLGDPALLVLDEPTVGLDPVLRRDLWDIFAALARRGTTLLVSSHVMDEALRCDRLVLLREGVVLADDTLAGLLQRTGAGDVEQAFLSLVEQRSPA